FRPARAELEVQKGSNAWLTMSLREGKNREVRRLMEHLGHIVTRLIRTSYGPFQLGNLPRGQVQEIPARVLRDQLPRA
ncbi:MAG: pseudouridine synthase, partial [Alphaproteobacteria bacterium]